MSDYEVHPLLPSQANVLVPLWMAFQDAQKRVMDSLTLVLSGAGIESANVSGVLQTPDGWVIQFQKTPAPGPQLVVADEK